jgi:RNA-splicing ligase RtcB
MEIIKGEFNQALVYAQTIDDTTRTQIKTLLDQSFTKDLRIRIMADCHAGAGCVIGTTMTIKDKIVPNLVGVDIGCGMLCIKLGKIDINLPELDEYIKKNVPSGREVHYRRTTESKTKIDTLRCIKAVGSDLQRHYKSVGTLGGGNHFIEIDIDEDEQKYLVIHTGSRNLGKRIAEYYQDKAISYHKDKTLNKQDLYLKAKEDYVRLGDAFDMKARINEIKKMVITLPMPEDLCYVEGELFDDYLFDMNIAQKFAVENRKTIAEIILKYLNLKLSKLEKFETIHNYIDIRKKILRKGSISAEKGKTAIIPINMKDGSIICIGKGNKDYNYSAPHGAGRVLSRSQASKTIDLKDYEEIMKGVYSTCISRATLDESPFAYKGIAEIMNNIQDTVDIVKVIKPIYNFKAEEERRY